jgi:uncharacterized protein
MGITSSILFGKVMHKRLFPKVNAFSYGVYYIAIPLSNIKQLPLSTERFGFLSFHTKDHGNRDGSDLEAWGRGILHKYGISEADGEIVLICMPRVLGYVFNPVSFWVCYDKYKKIRAVLCEVNNTFGETHTYLCAHPDHAEIKSDDVLKGEKVFHVSPFLSREGHYNFRFNISQDRCGFWIDYFDANGDKQLVTALTGNLEHMNNASLSKAFFGYPLVTFKGIILIHWQALKLVAKGIKYIPKPTQNKDKITATGNVTNL